MHWGTPNSVLANPLSTPFATVDNSALSLSYLGASCKTREDPSLISYHTCDAASSSSLDSEEELWAGWVPPGFCSEPAGRAEFIPLNPPLLPGAELTYPAQLLPPKGLLPPKKGECSATLDEPLSNHYTKVTHLPRDNKTLFPPWSGPALTASSW